MNTPQPKREDRPGKNQKGKPSAKPSGTSVPPPKAAAKPEDTKAPVTTPATGDQTASSTTSGDQKEATTKKNRKVSKTVIAWRAQENLPANGVITVKPEHLAKNPKSRGAAVRFALYKSGMTVEAYVKIAKENGISGALANADVRWDVAAGFITVEVPKSK